MFIQSTIKEMSMNFLAILFKIKCYFKSGFIHPNFKASAFYTNSGQIL